MRISRPVVGSAVTLALLGAFSLLNLGASCCVGDCGGDNGGKPRTYDDNGVTFQYPGSWQRGEDKNDKAANQLWSEPVLEDSERAILVTAYKLNKPITAESREANRASLDREVRAAIESDSASIQSGPRRIQVGGLPALQYAGVSRFDADTEAENTWTFVFDGETEYFINCSFAPTGKEDDARRAEVAAACEQLLTTFAVK